MNGLRMLLDTLVLSSCLSPRALRGQICVRSCSIVYYDGIYVVRTLVCFLLRVIDQNKNHHHPPSSLNPEKGLHEYHITLHGTRLISVRQVFENDGPYSPDFHSCIIVYYASRRLCG